MFLLLDLVQNMVVHVQFIVYPRWGGSRSVTVPISVSRIVGRIPIRPRLECSVDISSKLKDSAGLFAHEIGSEDSGLLGLLVAGYLKLPLFRAQDWNSGCRVAIHTVIIAVPASVHDKMEKVLSCVKSETSVPSPDMNPSRTSERTLAPVARNIKK